MKPEHPKSIRRRILTILYEQYLEDPLAVLSPTDLLEHGTIAREDLLANVHYLSDRGLVELMMGYNPPMFGAVRITANGIDLVEDRFEFDLRFPASPGEQEEATASLPMLLEQLVAEADFSPLDGEERRSLLRDVQYLRDELARPAERWRKSVALTVLGWIESRFANPAEVLPALDPIKRLVDGDAQGTEGG